MTKQVSLGYSINDIIPTVIFFHNNQPKFQQKDINQYSNLKELEDIIKNVGSSKRQEKLRISKEDADKIYEDDDILLLKPNSKDAVQKYRMGTKWYITMGTLHISL